MGGKYFITHLAKILNIMIKQRYSTVIRDVNNYVQKFNSELKNHTVEMEFLFDLEGLTWEDLNLDLANYRGVYILLGTDDVTNEVVIYIGKASWNSSIGKRIYDHFRRSHEKEGNPKYSYENEPCTIEYVYGINFSKENITYMAPALEEYLITNMPPKMLLNNLKNGE